VKRNRHIAIGVGALAATAAALSAGPAALAGPPPCERVCIFADANYSGQMVTIRGKGISNKLAEKMNNSASSVINATNDRVLLYSKRNARGFNFCVSPNSAVDWVGTDFNDVASSTKITDNERDCVEA
jgi:hypothetical protein